MTPPTTPQATPLTPEQVDKIEVCGVASTRIQHSLIRSLRAAWAKIEALESHATPSDTEMLDWLQSLVDRDKQRANNGCVEQRIQVFNNATLREAISAAMSESKTREGRG